MHLLLNLWIQYFYLFKRHIAQCQFLDIFFVGSIAFLHRASQWVSLGVNEFYFTRVVWPGCIFSFSLPKKVDLTVKIILALDWFCFFEMFLGFLVVVDMFNKVFTVFSWCFGLKMSFQMKKIEPLIFNKL